MHLKGRGNRRHQSIFFTSFFFLKKREEKEKKNLSSTECSQSESGPYTALINPGKEVHGVRSTSFSMGERGRKSIPFDLLKGYAGDYRPCMDKSHVAGGGVVKRRTTWG